MKKLWTILIVIIVLLVLFLLLGPFYMVNEGEQAVITRFGRIVDTETTSGLKLKMPVIDTVTKYPKMLLSWDGDAQRIPTKENQFIWVDATARWRIQDPALFYMTVKTVEGGIARLNDVLDSTIRTVISENYLNEAVRSTNRINSMEIEESVGSEVENAEDAELTAGAELTRERAALVYALLQEDDTAFLAFSLCVAAWLFPEVRDYLGQARRMTGRTSFRRHMQRARR